MARSYTQKRLDAIRAMQMRQGAQQLARVAATLAVPSASLPYRHSDGSVRKYVEGSTEKPCTKCLIVKPLEDYMPLKLGALGRHPVCNECRRKIGKEYTRKHRETKAGRDRPDRCDCCQTQRTLRRAMHWDHDHVTDQFRGWLCHHCNVTLGTVKDNIEHLQLLIEYLKRGGGPPRPMVR